MDKQKIRTQPFLYPMPMVVVGADVEDKPTFMPMAWITVGGYDPPRLVLAMGKSHVTNRGIHAHKQFGVSIPSGDLLPAVDYCGLVSARSRDKSRVFRTFAGELEHAPMVAECPLTMECRLLHVFDLDSHDLFVGEVVSTWSEGRFLDEKGRPDAGKIRPFTLTMPDNRYWAVGAHIADAWSAGRGYMSAEDLLP